MGLEILINGVDKTLNCKNLEIIEKINDQINECHFIFIGKKLDDLKVGWEVIIKKDGKKVFAGMILKKTPKLNPNRVEFAVNCGDYTILLTKRRVIKSFENVSSKEVIKEILKFPDYPTVPEDHELSTDYQYIEEGKKISIVLNYKSKLDSIKEIAERNDYIWWVDYDKKLHFQPRKKKYSNLEINDTVDWYKGLQVDFDRSQLRNRVIVRGKNLKSDETDTLVDFYEQTWNPDTQTRQWWLSYIPIASKLDGAENERDFKLYEDGVLKEVKIEKDEEEISGVYYLNKERGFVRQSSKDPNPVNKQIKVSYKYEFPIIIECNDKESQELIRSIEGGNGIYETFIERSNIRSFEEAQDVGKTELLKSRQTKVSGSFETYKTDFKTGEMIKINLAGYNWNGEYMIQSIRAKWIGGVFIYTINFVSYFWNFIKWLKQLAEKDPEERKSETLIKTSDAGVENLAVNEVSFSYKQQDIFAFIWSADDEKTDKSTFWDAGGYWGEY